MLTNVTFDGVTLITGGQVITKVDHESSPDREINSYVIPREDGTVLVSVRYGAKDVAVEGVIIGTDAADMESQADELKELFSREQKELVLTEFAADDRTYVATVKSHSFDRGEYGPNAIRWSAVFHVPDGTGRGSAVSATIADFYGGDEFNPTLKQVTIDGTKAAKPVITLNVAPGGGTNWNADGFSIRNVTTGEKIAVLFAGAWDAGNSVVIDCEARRVTSDVGSTIFLEQDFLGVFPRFLPGVNDLEIKFGSIPVQEIVVDDPTDVNQGINQTSSNQYIAQSFELQRAETTVRTVFAIISKTGSPTSNFTVRIETDNLGAPSGNLAHANAEIVGTTFGSPGTTPDWEIARFTSPASLNANQRYWLVIRPQGGGTLDGSNYYTFWFPPGVIAPYALGNVAKSTDSGTTYANSAADIAFRVTAGGTDNGTNDRASVDFDYDPLYL